MSNITGFFNFVNIIWTVSILLGVVSSSKLIAPYLDKISANIIEVFVYLIVSAFLIGGKYTKTKNTSQFVALTGCIILIPCISYSLYLHLNNLDEINQVFEILTATCTIIWGSVAIVYNSWIIGVITLIAFYSFNGFIAFNVPFGYVIGFKSSDIIPKNMVLSFQLLLLFTILRIHKANIWYIEIFRPGVQFMATFIYFLGGLITSSKFYDTRGNSYIPMQFLMIFSYVLAMYFGNVYNIKQFRNVGGTYMFLYLIEKYVEIMWDFDTALVMFILSALLWISSYVISRYPEYFGIRQLFVE